MSPLDMEWLNPTKITFVAHVLVAESADSSWGHTLPLPTQPYYTQLTSTSVGSDPSGLTFLMKGINYSLIVNCQVGHIITVL